MWESQISQQSKAMFAWGFMGKDGVQQEGKQHSIAYLHKTAGKDCTGTDIWHTSVIALRSSNIWVGGGRRVGHVGGRHGSGLELRSSVVAHSA